MDDPAGPLGFWFAAKSAGNMKKERTGKASIAARDGVAKVAPLVSMTALDTGLAFCEPKLPPPSTLPGAGAYVGSNLGEMEENAEAVVWDILTLPVLKLGAHRSAGVRCTPDTQPRDANGRFAHCSHAR